jgi:hypothetical protein
LQEATPAAAMNIIQISALTIGIKMPDAMFANALRNSTIHAVIQRPFSHVMIAWFMHRASLANTFFGGMRVKMRPVFDFVR